MSKQFDVLVIGGGPGGYVAAIRAAQLRLQYGLLRIQPYADPRANPASAAPASTSAASRPRPCCVPRTLRRAQHSFTTHGIAAKGVSIDVPTMVGRKNTIVTQLTGGIKGLFKKNKVTGLNGHGSFAGKEGDLYKVKVGGKKSWLVSSSSPPAPSPVTCPAFRWTTRSSATTRVPSTSMPFPSAWASSAPASSAWRWVRCGAAWVRK